jgi:hypothetical protein
MHILKLVKLLFKRALHGQKNLARVGRQGIKHVWSLS